MRKPRIQHKLAGLALAEREQLADMLRHRKYDDVLAHVKKPRPEGFGLNISEKPLRTFWFKVGLLDAINARLPADNQISLALFESLATHEIYSLTSADAASIAEAHAQILRTTCDLAAASKSANELSTLQRLIDFPARTEIRTERMRIHMNKEERAQAKELRAEEMHAHKIKMAELHHQLAERNTIVREKSLIREKLSASSASSAVNSDSDHLGPYASNREELSERARIHFGVPKDEWDLRLARNRELFEKLYDDDGNLKDPSVTAETLATANSPAASPLESEISNLPFTPNRPNAQPSAETTDSNQTHSRGAFLPRPTSTSRDEITETTATSADQISQDNRDEEIPSLPSLSAPSAPPRLTTPPESAELAARVDRYTIARVREYNAYQNNYTPWPYKHSPPEYITEHRHCPCGNQCPCPVHESEEFGPFPEIFWKIRPFHPHYAAILHARNLPFRFPQELAA